VSVAVEVAEVSKRFRLYQEKYQSLKERVLHAGRNPHEDFWALRDVSFDVAEGETVGVLGRNGSGKSTLLKCVSGILQPTQGKIVVRGSLAALLELGAGFQPELSGRDNIYLNASLLGLSTKDVDRRFDDIVAFAELEQFIDNQVKFYSSGMFVRLGFAVAVNVEPDVLVVDEVLAVGDENFQRKCLARIKDFQDEGRTILFVTHSADLVRAICDRAVVLSSGQMLGLGPAAEAIHLYHDHLLEAGSGVAAGSAPSTPDATHRPVRIAGISLEHPGMEARNYLLPDEPLTVHVDLDSAERTDDVVFSIDMYDEVGQLIFASDTAVLDGRFDLEAGGHRADLSFDRVPLLEGAYTMSIGLMSRAGVVYDRRDQDARFEVMNPGRSRGRVAFELHADVRAASLS
jgi:ABC-2 type transport system ATP-binding protein